MLYFQDQSGFVPASKDQIIARAIELAAEHVSKGTCLTNARDTSEWLMLTIGRLPYEVFFVIYLDSRNRVIHWEELFRGTIDGATVHPREVVKSALLKNAAALILAHNHPSNVSLPSQADEIITRRLREALALIDVRILDHMVIGANNWHSFAEMGLL